MRITHDLPTHDLRLDLRNPIRRRFASLAMLAALTGIVLLTGCAPAEPGIESLKDSFAQQIAAIELVQDFERQGDAISFVRPDGAGEMIEWRVEIDSASVEPQSEEASPYRGLVESSWSLNGRPVRATGDVSNLPLWVLDTGISQSCWALWDAESESWGWT